MEQENAFEKQLSFVRHELRSQLTVIREGISLVLEGLLGECNDQQSSVLKPAFESVEKLNFLIGELVSNESFKAALEECARCNELPEDEMGKLKRKLLANISHEVRTPLTIVKEGLALLEEGVPGSLNEKQKQVVGNVKSNTDRLIDVVESMLTRHWRDIADIPEE